MEQGRSLAQTPTYAVATVVFVMVALGFFFNGCLEKAGKWLDRTKRKPLLAALEKIKEELMLFGLLSLLMGHWIEFVAKICVKSSALSSRFYPCARQADFEFSENTIFQTLVNPNSSVPREQMSNVLHRYCPEGHESFASHESLEQLHRFLFALATIHVSYSFAAIALAMIKIYSWRVWENQAQKMASQGGQGSPKSASKDVKMMRLSTFIFHHTSHPWSQNRVLVWLLCFSRQFWSSINRPDYMALRLGFLTTHELPLSYDFHSYLLRSMEEEFRDIVGISVPLWIYAIACIFLDFHGTNIYFFISFLPAVLIMLIGTKLHRIVVKLAVEIMDSQPVTGTHRFKLRDELFWFGKPRLLLWLIQFISFQNAFEMAMFIWSLWEIKGTSCFMDNKILLVIRLVFGVVSQFWCSFITFPLYVIVTQMGSKFKKSLIPENMRRSLHGWHIRSKHKHGGSTPLISPMSVTSLDSLVDGMDEPDKPAEINEEGNSLNTEHNLLSSEQAGIPESCIHDEESIQMPSYTNEILEAPEQHSSPIFDVYTSDEDTDIDDFDDVKEDPHKPLPSEPLHGHVI